MPIQYDEKKQVFHLQNAAVSYVIQILRGKYPAHLYWGKRIQCYDGALSLSYYDRAFAPQPAQWENDRVFSLDVQPQEYPFYGSGDFRIPAYQVQRADGTAIVDLTYSGHTIRRGKPALAGLPATYAVKDDADTLEIELSDSNGVMKAYLSYSIFEDFPVIARSVRFVNTGKHAFRLLQAASASVDFCDHNFDRVTLYGGHAWERNISRAPLFRGIQSTASARGASSHQQSPFLALVRPHTTESAGDVYAFSLVYSGNFAAQTEVEQFGTTRVVIGINPLDFAWYMEPKEEFQTPEAVMVYSPDGLTGMSQVYHNLYRTHLMRGKYQEVLRPVLVNNWEGTYFDFNEEKIDQIAACAADLGIELFVLDDGWFGRRDDDNSSLGDWVVNRRKLPGGMKALAEKIHGRGLRFGLWFEPEMMSADSDLYQAHPDWRLHVPDYPSAQGRHQLVLDLSRQDVCDYIIEAVSAILESAPIDYVKWDMNRHMTEIGSALLPPERQRETAHRYMLGLYRVMETITARFPNILFESCSGGGGRFDAGLLYYMPQAWASDNTDAVCRLKIQYGTSLVFPPISIGAHVSTVPNHQVGRVTPLQTRAFTAMSGNFGYELDLCALTPAEKEAVRQQVALYKQIRPTVQLGDFYRLLSPFAGNETAWMFCAKDGRQVVVMYFKEMAAPAAQIRVLKLAGLEADARYQVTAYQGAERMSLVYLDETAPSIAGKVFGGDELMYAGLTVEKIDADFAAYLWVFEKIS